MNPLAGMSVLITGANGFLGSAIGKELQRLKVRTVSAIWPSVSDVFDDGDAIAIDLRLPNACERLDDYGCFDAIVHCAALLPGVSSDIDVLISNQVMTYNLLEWGNRKQINHLIFASTCRVYGLQSQPCVETSPLLPPDVYAVSKISCEFLVKTMLADHAIPSCILRISAPYGPSSKAETVIRRFLLNSARGLPITLHGNGTRSQDFVYETDVAAAFCLALQSRAKGIYNLAGGASVSMRELAETALEIFGRDVERNMVFSGVDAQEEYRGNFPVDAAFHSFGYRPQTSIRDGLKYMAEAWGLL